MVTQAALLVAVQPQPAAAVTVAVPVAPLPGGVELFGETLTFQLPCCLIVTVCPATVSVPVRAEREVFAAMLNAAVPLPLPLAPEVIVSQVALLVAVQAHPASAVTVALLEPSAAARFNVVGATVKVQDEVAAACVTVIVSTATVSVHVRCDVEVVSSME